MDIERHYMLASLVRASGVGHWNVFDWGWADRWAKGVSPRAADAESLEDWPNGGTPIWRGGKPVADAEAFRTIGPPTPALNVGDDFKACGWLGHEEPGLGGDELWATEDPAIVRSRSGGQAVEKAEPVTSDTGAHPDLPPEWSGEYCDYCNTSHSAPCQDARESLGRRALLFLAEDYGEEFVKNFLRSHKV